MISLCISGQSVYLVVSLVPFPPSKKRFPFRHFQLLSINSLLFIFPKIQWWRKTIGSQVTNLFHATFPILCTSISIVQLKILFDGRQRETVSKIRNIIFHYDSTHSSKFNLENGIISFDLIGCCELSTFFCSMVMLAAFSMIIIVSGENS